jgi:hypothetical protein
VLSVDIAGTLDGSHESSITLATPALPALLICATKTNTTKVLDINSLTIDHSGWLTSRNTATLAITTAVKGGIYNHGSITGDTCVQIGKPAALADFFLDGSFTNKGLISANQPNGKAFVIAGNKTANINSFSVHNFGMLSGNLEFEADSSDFKYRLENINYIVKHGNYKVGDRDDSIIEAATLEVKNSHLTVYNEHIITIDNLQVQATKKTIVNLESKNNIFATVYPQAGGKQPAQINIKNSLINSNLGVITIAGTVVINKLVNPYNGTVTFTDSNINLQEVTNSGYIEAQNKLSVSGVATNSKKGYLIANGVLTFNNHLTNYGTITTRKTLNINAQADNFGYINALAGLNATGAFTNNLAGAVTIKTGSATFSALVTNLGSITATSGLLTFTNKVENSGIITAKAGILANKLLVNHQGATLSISGHNKAHINSLTNDGVVYCKNVELKLLSQSINRGLIDTNHGFDATDFTNQQGATLTVSGLHATFSKNFINRGYINSTAHVSTNAATNSGVLIATSGMHAKNKFINAQGGSLTVSGGDLIFTKTLINDGSITTKDHQLELQQPSINHGFIDAKAGVETTQTFTNGTNARLILCDHIDILGQARITSIKYFPLTIGTATISKLIATKDPIGRNLILSGRTYIQDLINSTKITAKARLTLTEMSNSGTIIAKDKLDFTKEATNAGIIEAHKGLNISSGTFTNKDKATLTVTGGNLHVDAFLANSGAITSDESACFIKEVTNSGLIQANFGLHAHEKLTNSLGGRLIVKAKPLDIHGYLINHGTITSEKQVVFNKPVLNTGIIDAQLELGMHASVTNANQAQILAHGGLLTIIGKVNNSGFIEAKQGMHAKSDLNNNIGARILVNTEKLILTKASNSGYIKADNGLTVKGPYTNYNQGELLVNGDDLTINGKVVNSGSITSAKLTSFYQDTTNNGYIEANLGLNIDRNFTNNSTATTVIKGQIFNVNGTVYNYGTITSSNLINIQELTNSGYIKSGNGLTIEGTSTLYNSKNSTLEVTGRALTVHGSTINLGTITSTKSIYCSDTVHNWGYIKVNDSLSINEDFTNYASATTIMNGRNLSVHGVVNNYGTITSKGCIVFRKYANNYGYIKANHGLAITGPRPFYNSSTATIVITGAELIIHGAVTNLGTITSTKPIFLSRETMNSGYLRSDLSFTTDASFTNKGSTIVDGENFAVNGMMNNSGTIISKGFIKVKGDASNSGYIRANSGIAIAGLNTFTNSKNAVINVDGGLLDIRSMVINLGTITCTNPGYFAKGAVNSGYLKVDLGLTIDASFTNTANTIVGGENFTVRGMVNNSGTITSVGFISFNEEATNSGYIEANYGFSIAGPTTFTNTKNAALYVNGKELAIHGRVINLGTITSTKQAYLARGAVNSGYLRADSGLTMDASFTNKGNTIVGGIVFTVHGMVNNSGTITSTGFATFKEEATNSGYIAANAGLNITGSNTFTNSKNAVIYVDGRELAINGKVINLGTITTTKQSYFARGAVNSGYLRADSGLTMDDAFTNKANTIIGGNNFTVHGIMSNSGTITSKGIISVKEESSNDGYIEANNGFNILGSNTFTNSKNAVINVAGRELSINGMVINLGTITSTKQAHFARGAFNNGYLRADLGLIMDGSFTNKTNTIVSGKNFTVHGIVNNSGTITSAGAITFQDIAANSGYIEANNGFSVLGSHTFTNSPNAVIKTDGKFLVFNNKVINLGTITSTKPAYIAKGGINNGYIRADSGLMMDASFTNTTNVIVGGNNFTVNGLVNNSGTITSKGLITFKEEATNSGYIEANNGLTIAGANTFTNTKNAHIIVKGKELTIHSVIINSGTISSTKNVHFYRTTNNNNYLETDAGLTIDGSFNNSASATTIAKNKHLTVHGAVHNSGTITVAGLINIQKQTINDNYIEANSGLIIASSFINNKNALTTVSTNELTVQGMVTNFGTITSDDLITFTKGANNNSYIRAKNGIAANGTITNTANAKIAIYDNIKIRGKASIKGVDILRHGCSFGSSTICNLKITNNKKDLVFFGSSTIAKLSNVGFIRSDAPLTIVDASNSGKLIANNNLTFINTATNSGIIIANEHIMQFSKNAYNTGDIKATAGLIVEGTLTSFNNSNVTIHNSVVIENTATILGITNTSRHTVVFGTATIARLINHSKTNIKFLATTDITQLFNDNYILANATISLGEVSNTGVIHAQQTMTIHNSGYNENYIFAKQGLIANATFTNTKSAQVLIDHGVASFHSFVDNFGIITTENVKLEFNSNSFNAGKIIANKGLTITGNFTNKSGSVTVSGDDAVFNKTVDNTGVITTNGRVLFNDNLVNAGEIRANAELDLMQILTNKSEGKIFGSRLLQSSFNIIDNHGFIAIAAGSNAKQYHGYADSELQITLPTKKPNSELFFIVNTAKFDATARIILDATTDLEYLQQGAKLTILSANKIQLADDLKELLCRYIKPKNYFLSINDAVIINNSIEATVQQDINKILNLIDKYVKFSKSLLKKDIANINDIKVYEEMSGPIKLSQADKGSVVLNQITSIITKNNITGIDINSIKTEISIPSYETYRTAETQNKITSKVSNKITTDKKQYQFWNKNGINFTIQDKPDVVWLLASYHQGIDQKVATNNEYNTYKDKLICVGIKHDISYFNAGVSMAYADSNRYTYKKDKTNKAKKISSNNREAFILLLHAMRDYSDFNGLVSFSYGQISHKSSSETTFDNRNYSVALSGNYEIHINNFNIELGLTSRLIHIYTPSYSIAKNKRVMAINNNSDYVSLGPVISVIFNHKLTDKSGLSMECSFGYLHTFSINTNKKYELAIANHKFSLDHGNYGKNSIYLINKLHFFSGNILFGLDFNWSHDTEKNIYGVSLLTGFRF